jgi:hypothetical protein
MSPDLLLVMDLTPVELVDPELSQEEQEVELLTLVG